jgi:predicted dehydrogenase
MTTDPMRIAIVGCGAITQVYYAPALREVLAPENVEVSLLVDPNAQALEAVGSLFPNATRIASLDDSYDVVDAAIVATPAQMHISHTTKLLSAGAHVLCEKPMAASVAQCEAMLDASRRANKRLAVGHFRRFFPGTQQVMSFIESGALGKPIKFEISEGNRFQWRARTDSFFRKSIGGGGVLLDIGAHVLDLMVWWFGEPIDVRYEDDSMGGIEANCRILCRFGSGLRGVVRLSRDWNLLNRYFIQFERGWVAWSPSSPSAIEFGLSSGFAMKAVMHKPVHEFGHTRLGEEAANYYGAFKLQLQNFFDAVRGRCALAVPGSEAIKSVRLIERCYSKPRLIDMPWLTASEISAAESLKC